MPKSCVLNYVFLHKGPQGAIRARTKGQNRTKLVIFFRLCMGIKNVFSTFFFIFRLQKAIIILKLFECLAAWAVFDSPFYLFLPRNSNFWQDNYPDLHHLHGVWNLPHKFPLYLIPVINYIQKYSQVHFENIFFWLFFPVQVWQMQQEVQLGEW